MSDVIVRFDNVSFEWGINKPILDGVSFTIRRGMKLTLMGQNGAGKSTIFGLIAGLHTPESGIINIVKGVSIATSRQVIPPNEMNLTVREFFISFAKATAGQGKIYNIDKLIDDVLEVVNLKGHTKIHDQIIKDFSGGQQARLLLASALIQDPDLLLLDEPTNNLDKAGIAHLTKFLIDYQKTVLVISHDAEFLNAFTEGVLYLDVYTKKIEQYVGNYFNVVKDITARVEKENMKNAQLQEEIVDVRKEDKSIRPFNIPSQPDLIGEILHISSFETLKNGKKVKHKAKISLNKNMHLLLQGPNGIGKTTLLERLASCHAAGEKVKEGIRIGYSRQDFSTLNFEDTVYQSLSSAMLAGGEKLDEERK